VGRQK
jgi:transposase